LAFPETGNGVGFVLAIFYELEGGGAKFSLAGQASSRTLNGATDARAAQTG
jgi:hypothetical protein